MWPWGHAIVGYLAYSLLCRLVGRTRPSGLDAFAVVFASVLPDLVDKPLAWEFGVFDTGYALGHSLLFALPVVAIVGVVARWRDRTRAGIAFAVGYLLHLPGDLFMYYAGDGEVRLDVVLWPVLKAPSHSRPEGLLGTTRRMFGEYLSSILAGDVSGSAWLQIGMATAALLVWLADGAPVLREFLRGCGRLARSAAGR